ncbi:MAG: AbrB/MazE/SpoVT family DNA-binding domain-containing protein [Candidatus Heimdallarchaeaceae archaeon]
MTLETRIFEIGGSLAVVIPRDICDLLDLKVNDELEVDISKTPSEKVIILKK